MAIMMRFVYLVALIAVAAIYTATMPPESLTILNLAKYLLPATGVGMLFILAKGVLGEGLIHHVIALLIVIAVITFVSMGLSATGLVTGVRTAAGIIGGIGDVTGLSNVSDVLANVSAHG